MTVIKIQLNQEIRKYVDVNMQLSRIYNFIFKKFENVPSYFELQYRHPLNKIRRQLCDNDQLSALLSLKQTLTLLIRPITCENISRFQISRAAHHNNPTTTTPSSTQPIPFDICALLDNLSLHQHQSHHAISLSSPNQSERSPREEQLQTAISQEPPADRTITTTTTTTTTITTTSTFQTTPPPSEFATAFSIHVTDPTNHQVQYMIDCSEEIEQTTIVQDNSDYLIKDETSDYIMEQMPLMTYYDEEDRSASQIEISFD